MLDFIGTGYLCFVVTLCLSIFLRLSHFLFSFSILHAFSSSSSWLVGCFCFGFRRSCFAFNFIYLFSFLLFCLLFSSIALVKVLISAFVVLVWCSFSVISSFYSLVLFCIVSTRILFWCTSFFLLYVLSNLLDFNRNIWISFLPACNRATPHNWVFVCFEEANILPPRNLESPCKRDWKESLVITSRKRRVLKLLITFTAHKLFFRKGKKWESFCGARWRSIVR